MIYKIESISQAFDLFKNKLEAAVGELDDNNKVYVEVAASINNHQLRSPRGALLLTYLGSIYTSTEETNNIIAMKRDLKIGVVPIIQFYDKLMMPADYIDFVVETMSGIEVENTRPEYEKKIYPIKADFVDETSGKWIYVAAFAVPVDFFEKSLINN